MKITLTIPDREWYALSGKAEKSGVKIADLVAAAVVGLVHDNPSRVVLRDQVQHLVERGIPDPVIAHRLRIAVDHARKVRRELGLKPVRFRREQWEQELSGRDIPGLSDLREAS